MGAETGSATSQSEVALVSWRRMATDILLSVSAIVYLPAVVLMLAGKGPAVATPMHAVLVIVYLIVVAGALLRRINHQTRAWAMLIGAYVLAFLGNVAVPYGPFVRSFPVILPVLAMVLVGARAGRAATAVSAPILLFAPLLHNVPQLAGIITAAPADAPESLSLLWTQGAGLTGLLFTIMVLLDRFHQLLVDSMAKLQREATERAAAYQKLEHEMAERRRLEREVAHASDEERRRLGVDIHDGVCQQLTGALLRCEALERRVDRGDAIRSEDVTALASLLEETIDEAHAVARGLWPIEASPTALVTALRRLAEETERTAVVSCRFVPNGDVSVSNPITARHLYRIAQEAMSNAARHAHAAHISIELHVDDQELRLLVVDDGVGLDVGIPATGMGLRTMAYRARLLEGDLTVDRAAAKGTIVTCRVPRAGLGKPLAPHQRQEALV